MNDDENGSEGYGDNVLDRLVDIFDNPEKRILPLLYSHDARNDNNNHGGTSKYINHNKESVRDKHKTLGELLEISKTLFLDIESLGRQYAEFHEKSKRATALSTDEEKNKPTSTTTVSSILSGLTELHVPEVKITDTDLPETIFGQVDLQNTALAKLVRKSSKRLLKATTDDICVLDMGVMNSDDEDDGDGDNDDNDESDDNSDELQAHYDEDGSGSNSDEETQRIRQRMERVMEDAEEESSGEGVEDDNGGKEVSVEEEIKEELYDPVVEDMKDGFFDLNEMEDFADEEEDYLPNESFDHSNTFEVNKEQVVKKKSFHQRQREGHMDHDNSDEDESDLDELYEEVKDVRRKQYREQDDIDALYDLYQETNPDEDDDDDVVNVTAAEFLGAPRKNFIERYRKNHQPNKKSLENVSKNDDDDSWGEYDFEKEDEAGWRDDHPEDQHDDDDEEEMEDMKGPEVNGAIEEARDISIRKNDKKKFFTKQEEKLRRQTDELEKELIDEKPWQMKGESKSMSRPVNSLLEGTPGFEMASKQAPIITVEHTIDLEEAIKRRIIAEDWDDVVPRELPDIGWDKKRGEAPEVSQEKSKLGLGELYEREYLKKAVGYDKDAAEKQTEEDKAKDEMKQLFANLCSKLDALSNYHFAPRPIADEAEARPVTVPAIAMEEVLPLYVSDARGVAPEEVYAPKRGRDGILRADSEMDQDDRKRQRQSKKAARRKARKEKEADEKLISRLQPGLGLNNPYEKRKVREELSLARARGKVTEGEKDTDTKFGSSGTFFKRLQVEVQQKVHDHASEQPGDGLEKKF